MKPYVSVMKWVLPAMMLAPSGVAHATTNATTGCVTSSRTPEAHTFYGDRKALASKVNAANLQINDRRLYLYTIETSKGAELAVFEREPAGDQLKVSRWKGASLGNLKERLNEVMMSNQGKHCIGERSTALINARFNLKPAGERTPPSSVGEIVALDTQVQDSDFARVSFFLLC